MIVPSAVATRPLNGLLKTAVIAEGVSAHCSGFSNFGTTKPSRLRCFAYATTVGCRTLASFTRTQTLVAPMTPVEPRKASTFDSADSRDASATLSSKSSIIASAPLASAFVSARDDRRGRTTLAHVGSTFGGPPVQGQGVASTHAWHDRGVSQLQALEIDDAIQGCQ